MTVLDNGVVIDESFTAVYKTAGAACLGTFGYARSVKASTLHHWGESGQKFDDVVNFLRSENSRKVSAHFVVQDGRVTCLVSPLDAAWHAGDAFGNAQTIGIECRPEMTSGDVATLASLLRFLEATYGEQAIYIHQNFANTECPGKYGTPSAIENLVKQINGKAVNVVPVKGKAVKCSCV